jgi:hypothetical protein
VSWAAPLAALHLMSGAGQRFSTWNTHSAPRSSRTGDPLRALHRQFEIVRPSPPRRCPTSARPMKCPVSGCQPRTARTEPHRRRTRPERGRHRAPQRGQRTVAQRLPLRGFRSEAARPLRRLQRPGHHRTLLEPARARHDEANMAASDRFGRKPRQEQPSDCCSEADLTARSVPRGLAQLAQSASAHGGHRTAPPLVKAGAPGVSRS